MTFGPSNTQSSYLPPEQDFPEDNDIFREILSNRERLTANILNIKENAQYEKNEIITGQQWFSQITTGAIKTTYTYRLAFDLVALNGGVAIPIGITTLTLSSSTQPASITIPTSVQPVHGFGAANNGTNFYFINDPLLFVKTNVWTTGSQQIIITNNTGATLTQAVWVFEYFKF
jgi:hypothetical protein